MRLMTRIKICCIGGIAAAQLAAVATNT